MPQRLQLEGVHSGAVVDQNQQVEHAGAVRKEVAGSVPKVVTITFVPDRSKLKPLEPVLQTLTLYGQTLVARDVKKKTVSSQGLNWLCGE